MGEQGKTTPFAAGRVGGSEIGVADALATIVIAEADTLNSLSAAVEGAKAFTVAAKLMQEAASEIADAKDKGIHAIDEHVEKVVKPRIDQYVVTAITGAMQALSRLQSLLDPFLELFRKGE